MSPSGPRGVPAEASDAPRPTVRRRGAAFCDSVWDGFDLLVGTGAPWRRSRYAVVIGWVVTRTVMVLLLISLERTIINDVRYYGAGIAELGPSSPVSAILREYPTPVLGLLALPWLLSFGGIDTYVVLFLAMMLAFDALFTWLLVRRHGDAGSAGTAVTLWLVAGPALGPLAITRFDVLPGMLAGAAVLLLAARPRLVGAFIAIGAAIKLWPALLLPAVLAPRSTRWRTLAGALAGGVVILAAALAAGGWGRLLSPLTYQSDRGLQVESLAALPLMIVWSVAHGPWQIAFTKFITSEISGPGDQVMLTLVTVATALAVALMVLLWWRAWRVRPQVSTATVGWIMLSCTALFIVTNKVMSPQYLLWLSPVAVAVVASSRRSDLGARRFTVLLVLTGVITQVIYPNTYVLVTEMSWANPIGVFMLLVRDAALLALTWYAVRRSWLGTRGAPASTVTVRRSGTAGRPAGRG